MVALSWFSLAGAIITSLVGQALLKGAAERHSFLEQLWDWRISALCCNWVNISWRDTNWHHSHLMPCHFRLLHSSNSGQAVLSVAVESFLAELSDKTHGDSRCDHRCGSRWPFHLL
jgi:hypothetical protein